MAEWTVVYKTLINSRAQIVQGVLTDRGIEAVIVNKKDSTLIINNGQIEVRVPEEQVLDAMKIVTDEISFE